MIILVCGDRDWIDSQKLNQILQPYVSPKNIIIEGGARGADTMAGSFFRLRGVHVAVVDALWRVLGKPAGSIRNRAMAMLNPELVIAFCSDISQSRGTADMLSIAEALDIDYYLVE